MNKLEKDFDELAKQINSKIVEASLILKEVNSLKNKAGLISLIYTSYISEDIAYFNKGKSEEEISQMTEDFYQKIKKIKVKPLEEAISDLGWNTSSTYC